MYNVAIVGGGPAGIFAALEIVKLKPEWKVVLVEKGVQIEKRKCLLREGYEKCPTCKKCGLLCGWGGAGAFSDGKLTLTPDVGGHLLDYMSRKNVEDLTFMLENVIRSGTGKRAQISGFAAGKTGTSQDNRDAWFVGFNDKYVTAVWLGNDDNSPMKGVSGSNLPAEIWKKVMSAAK